ncbi:MAG: hypothetical protein HYU36_14380 [Planctomycetes bacterium]|nr:hypothetical protein [Planctomycetota bacterium]
MATAKGSPVDEKLEKTSTQSPEKAAPKTRPLPAPHVAHCGGWLYTLCPQKNCMEIVSVPCLDSGKETACPQCGTRYRISTSYVPYTCKCGKAFRIAAGFHGIVVKCSYCGVTSKIIEGDTPARPCELHGFLYFYCSNPQCRTPLIQKESYRGMDTECPKCRTRVTLPYQSELDPLRENISLLQFLMPVAQLKEKCRVCGQPIEGRCPTCADLSVEATGKLLLYEAHILQFLKEPDFSASAVLRLGEASVDIADRNFYAAGTLIHYEFVGKTGETIGEAAFKVKSLSPFVTQNRLLRYALIPVPNVEIWKKKREYVLARLPAEMQESLFLASEP